jgi:DNA-binding LacI/PurR family transcriptional regulator
MRGTKEPADPHGQPQGVDGRDQPPHVDGRDRPRQPAARNRPATMKDIAIATGVSRSTVSRILNDVPLAVQVSQDTRKRVLAVARDLGYRPNPLARALRGAPTMLLGAIVRDITDPFFAGAGEAVSSAARARGYNIVLGLAHARATEAYELAAVLEARQCDAILLLGDMGDQPRLLADLRDAHVPVVTMWQGTRLDLIPGVQVDNRLGTHMAVEHLIGLGHRRIAFVGGRLLGDIRERQAAYAEAVAAVLDPVPAGYIQHVANAPDGGEAALGALLRLSPRPTAIVASTDVLAIGVLRGALLRGVNVPGELSVIGFDDIATARVAVPSLTTIRMPIETMAAEAIALAVGPPDEAGDGRNGTAGTAVDGSAARDSRGSSAGAASAAGGAGTTTLRRGRSEVRVFAPSLVIRESTAAPADDQPPQEGSRPTRELTA